jgi:hypothetical protein
MQSSRDGNDAGESLAPSQNIENNPMHSSGTRRAPKQAFDASGKSARYCQHPMDWGVDSLAQLNSD